MALSPQLQSQLLGSSLRYPPAVIPKSVSRPPEYGGISTFENVGRTGSSFFNTALTFTGAGTLGLLGAEAVGWLGTSMVDRNGNLTRSLQESGKSQGAGVQAPETVDLPTDFLDPYKKGDFSFNSSNVPTLATGVMQSSEIIAQSIASLIQITADAHAEHMQYLTGGILATVDTGSRIATALESLSPLILGVVETLNLPTTSDAILSNAGVIANAISSQDAPNINNNVNLDVAPIVAQLAQNSKDADERQNKSDNSFRQTYIPSGEFWAKADSATVKYNRIVGTSAAFDYLPSVTQLLSEVTMISSLVDAGENQSTIIKEIEAFRKNSLSSSVYALTMYSDDVLNSQAELNASMKKYYDNALESKIPETTVTISNHLSDIAQWSRSAKSREDFLQSPKHFKDSDGDIIASASPMEISADKDAQLYKNLDDKNTEKFDDNDFNSPVDVMPIIPFIGREDSFNPQKQFPSSNVFLDKLKSLFPSFF